jgi:LPS sulfotransferase NodH
MNGPNRYNPTPHLTYFVCTSPRTGSWLLTDMLRQTGIAGRPAEHFDPNPDHERYWFERLGIASEAAYLPKIMGRATTPNGVFGSKLHWYQFGRLCERLGCTTPHSVPRALASAFPNLRYIWMRRRDVLAQAISLYRAQRPGTG